MNVVTSGLTGSDAVLVKVIATQGSAPRDAGTWMIVFADVCEGTIGGGHLELQAMRQAREMLAATDAQASRQMHYVLGPSLGQCCGGVVDLHLERVSRRKLPALRQRLASGYVPVALFGGGHVGAAIVNALAPLPFSIRWIDSRDEIFPSTLPANVQCEHSDPVQAAVADLAPASRALIMSFSHAEDLDVVAACLQRLRNRNDLAFIGLIGSKTKWATFRHRLQARGFSDNELARVTCPIGLPGIPGKEPAVIAAGVAAQLLQLQNK